MIHDRFKVMKRYRVPVIHDGQEKVMELGEAMHRKLQEELGKHYIDMEVKLHLHIPKDRPRNPFVLNTHVEFQELIQEGFVWAPYVPVIRTDKLKMPDHAQDLTPMKGVMTRYAKKLLKPEYYGTVSIGDIGDNPCAEIPLDRVIGDAINESAKRILTPGFIADPKAYPHKCTRCGAPAYVGFTTVDCSRKSCF